MDLRVLFFVLTVQCINGQIDPLICVPKDDTHGSVQPTYSMKKKNEDLILIFNKFTECELEVIGYKKMKFNATVSKISFPVDPRCVNFAVRGYLKLPYTDENLKLQVCDSMPVLKPVTSEESRFYFFITTAYMNPPQKQPFPANLTLNFKSIQGPECGTPEIKLTKSIQKINFPATTMEFSDQSECDVKLYGYNGQDFKMTITFTNQNCHDGYVAAAAKETELDTESAKQCATKTHVSSSQSGIMYLRFVANNSKLKFTLELETVETSPDVITTPMSTSTTDVGNRIHGMYAMVSFSICKLLWTIVFQDCGQYNLFA